MEEENAKKEAKHEEKQKRKEHYEKYGTKRLGPTKFKQRDVEVTYFFLFLPPFSGGIRKDEHRPEQARDRRIINYHGDEYKRNRNLCR